jgi:hypothetical protein
MKHLVLAFCVMASTAALGHERNTPLDLRVTHATVTRSMFAQPAPISEAQSRMEDMARGAQDRVVSALETAQHLGSRYHTWLWVTPSFGYVNGASLRFDFR